MSISRSHWIFGAALVMASPMRVVSSQSLSPTLARLSSDDAVVRAAALEQLTARAATDRFALCSPSASNEIKASLIAALEKENIAIHSKRWGEDEGDFHASLIGCVAALRDNRGAHALVGAIDTGWGALYGIFDLGDAAVPEVAAALRDPTSRSTARMAAATTLGMFVGQALPKPVPGQRWVGPKPVSTASRAMIRESLIAALVDKNPMVGSAAVTSLGAFSGDDISRAILAAAKSDSGIQFGSSARKFPVKEAARTWLRQDSLKIKK